MVKIKVKPEDFVVEEVGTVKPKKKEDEYSYVLVTKKEWTTARAIRVIAKRLRVSKTRIGFSGNKDKNAITSQVISIWKTKKEAIERLKIKDIDLKFLGYGDERINLGDHEKNKFIVKLRSVSAAELATLEKQMKLIKANGFPNYFGAQRFGSSENSHLIGKYIILGDFEKAVKRLLGKNPGRNWKKLLEKTPVGKKMERAVLHHLVRYENDYAGALRTIMKPTRRIFVHAYQSWIFNKALSELIAEKGPYKAVEFLDFKISFPQEVLKGVPNKINIPGTKINPNKGELSKIYQRILKEEGMTLEDFACKRMPELASEGSERTAFVKPGNLTSSIEGKSMTLEFELEKGSYATMLFSALFLKNIK